MTRPTLLIDGNNILVRAVEATRRTAMHSPDGTDTRALVVTIGTLSRYIRQVQPYSAIVLWDDTSGETGWRNTLYPDYKATRPQAPDSYRSGSRTLTREFLDLAGIPQLSYPRYEADDLIGALWRRADTPVTILSSDKDLLQLVGSTPHGHACDQIRVSSADTATELWDATRVEEHFGCTPEQLPIAMSLAGDPGDNIPGVPRIAMKTAVKHLSAAGWDPSAIEHPTVVKHQDDIDLYRLLVDLRRPSSIDSAMPRIAPFLPTAPGADGRWRALWAFLDRHGLHRTRSQLMNGQLW